MLLSATDVYADATARQMLQGKPLSRAVGGIKLVLEALSSVYLTSAAAWCQSQGIQWMDGWIQTQGREPSTCSTLSGQKTRTHLEQSSRTYNYLESQKTWGVPVIRAIPIRVVRILGQLYALCTYHASTAKGGT